MSIGLANRTMYTGISGPPQLDGLTDDNISFSQQHLKVLRQRSSPPMQYQIHDNNDQLNLPQIQSLSFFDIP